MIVWIKTVHCRSKMHCVMCRSRKSSNWRIGLRSVFSLPNNDADFNCPYGVIWGFDSKRKTDDIVVDIAESPSIIGVAEWNRVQHDINEEGSDEIKTLLRLYWGKLMLSTKTCWINDARSGIVRLWEKEKAGKVMAPTLGIRYIESN